MTKWPTDSSGLIDPVAAHEQYSKEAREHYARLADKPQMTDFQVISAALNVTPRLIEDAILQANGLSALCRVEDAIRTALNYHQVTHIHAALRKALPE